MPLMKSYLTSSPRPIFILKLAGQKKFCPDNFIIKIGPGDDAL